MRSSTKYFSFISISNNYGIKIIFIFYFWFKALLLFYKIKFY